MQVHFIQLIMLMMAKPRLWSIWTSESAFFISPVLEIRLILASNSKHSDVMDERKKTLLPSLLDCTAVSLESHSLPRNFRLLVGC